MTVAETVTPTVAETNSMMSNVADITLTVALIVAETMTVAWTVALAATQTMVSNMADTVTLTLVAAVTVTVAKAVILTMSETPAKAKAVPALVRQSSPARSRKWPPSTSCYTHTTNMRAT